MSSIADGTDTETVELDTESVIESDEPSEQFVRDGRDEDHCPDPARDVVRQPSYGDTRQHDQIDLGDRPERVRAGLWCVRDNRNQVGTGEGADIGDV